MPLRYADLTAVWGEGNVVRMSSLGAEYARLPAEAQRVLTQVGLPREVEYFFTQQGPEWVTDADGVRKYCKIGSDYGTDICVVADSGLLLSVSASGGYPVRFVNSGLAFFVEFLCRVVSARRSYIGLDDEEVDPLVKSLEPELRARDPQAFATADRWWSVIFEQMKVGLL
jgi:hypothetical protein